MPVAPLFLTSLFFWMFASKNSLFKYLSTVQFKSGIYCHAFVKHHTKLGYLQLQREVMLIDKNIDFQKIDFFPLRKHLCNSVVGRKNEVHRFIWYTQYFYFIYVSVLSFCVVQYTLQSLIGAIVFSTEIITL